jgi:protein ImuA
LISQSDELALTQGRVHEASGPARRTFAIWLAARTRGSVFWLSPAWSQDQLNCDGLQPMIDPARLVYVRPKRAEDLLWSMEEVLRSGAVALCIADLPALPGLTQVRRMHLAAETGGQNGGHLPIGLLLTPGQGGAPGVETRWTLSPRHTKARDGWQLDRVRARTLPPKSWQIESDHRSGTLRLKTA